jgi:nucleotide-binding universal stress UspA family protein
MNLNAGPFGREFVILRLSLVEDKVMKVMEPKIAFSLKNILLAIDFSAASESAVPYARSIARLCSSNVQVVHVNGSDSYHMLPAQAFRIAVTKGHALPDGHLGLLETLMSGLPNEAPLLHGNVPEVIADVISRNKTDLVILGTHGRRGLPKLIWGSVAEQIFRNVWCPVMTLGPSVEPVKEELSFQRILLASDLNSHSTAPLYASWLCNQLGGALMAVHVADENNGTTDDLQKVRKLESLVALECPVIPPRFTVEHGSPATMILEAIETFHPDVAVLGVRHPSNATIEAHLPWSIASRVIAEARCPVLTVRESR